MTLRSSRRLMPVFLLASVAVFALLLLAMEQDTRREWKSWQRAYRGAGGGHVDRLRIHQIQIPALNHVDRCTTCHLAVDDPGFADAAHPLRTHPDYLRHPFETFGCTVCHRGNGLATNATDAHAGMRPAAFLTASCLACHDLDGLPGADRLRAGRDLFADNGCLACHQLDGIGGRAAPALDGVGDRRDPDWMTRHFRDPAAVSPGSAMPPVRLSGEETETLALYVQSLVPPVRDPYFESSRVMPTPEAGRDLFLSRGCIGCHALDGVGGQLGPDLSRLGRRATSSWLNLFLQQPHQLRPGTPMPAPGLRDDERAALIAFLLRLNG